MKVWRLYKKPTDSDFDYNPYMTLSDKYPLYGITNSKKLINKFLEIRDKNKFIILSDDSMDEDDYVDLVNHNRGALISQFRLKTSKNKKVSNVDLVMTHMEYNNVVESATVLLDGVLEDMPGYLPVKAVKDKYYKIIESIGFAAMYRMAVNDEGIDDYSMPYITHDELNVFLYLYQDILK